MASETATDPSGHQIRPGTQRKKHRHDLGHEDHGPVVAQGTTRGIQVLLGLWIALTLALCVYAMVDGARTYNVPAPAASPTAAGR